MPKSINIALVGNPNSGKSSLFNSLTGLKQQVGNFPGVTVDKKTGSCKIGEELNATLIDLPGTYSLYPKRSDEWVAYRVLLNRDESTRPDLVMLVADASNLKRNLLFCSQIIDLNIPVIVALTMMDLSNPGISICVPFCTCTDNSSSKNEILTSWPFAFSNNRIIFERLNSDISFLKVNF